MKTRFKFPVSGQKQMYYCCCTNCPYPVDYSPAQPTRYGLTLTGLDLTVSAGNVPAGSLCCNQPPCVPSCPAPGFPNQYYWGQAWGTIPWDGVYALDSCTKYQTFPDLPPGCINTSDCLGEPATPAVWNGWYALFWENQQTLQCCSPASCCYEGQIFNCAWLRMQLILKLEGCLQDPSDPIRADWDLKIWPYYQAYWWCPYGSVWGVYGTVPNAAPVCCPQDGLTFQTNTCWFTGSTTFTGTLQPNGHVSGVAPLPTSWVGGNASALVWTLNKSCDLIFGGTSGTWGILPANMSLAEI